MTFRLWRYKPIKEIQLISLPYSSEHAVCWYHPRERLFNRFPLNEQISHPQYFHVSTKQFAFLSAWHCTVMSTTSGRYTSRRASFLSALPSPRRGRISNVVSANIIIFPRALSHPSPPEGAAAALPRCLTRNVRSFARVAYLIDGHRHRPLFSGGGDESGGQRPHRLLPRRPRLRRRSSRLPRRRFKLRLGLQHLRLPLLRAHRRQRHWVGEERARALYMFSTRQTHMSGAVPKVYLWVPF